MTTRAQVREAARAQTTRSGRVPQSAIDAELQSFDDKDLRLRSVAKGVRKREAKRRLMDLDIKAGQPGSDLCTCIVRAGQLYVQCTDDADPLCLIHGTHRTVDAYIHMI